MKTNTYFTHSEMLLIHESLVHSLERYNFLLESASDSLKSKLQYKLEDLHTLNQRVQSYLLSQLP